MADQQRLDIDTLIIRLLKVRGSRPGKNVQLSYQDIKSLCAESSEIFPSQPILLELENELKTCFIDKDEKEEIKEEVRMDVKRTDYITWDEYFMSVALLAAKRSKDPSTQVGACIVSEENKIVATGYNGMPNGVHDDSIPWKKEGAFLDTKYAYVVHAELNAILNCNLSNQKSCRVYVSLYPCNECAKAIIQVGIRHVIYLSDKHKERESTKAAKIMFEMAGVLCEQYSSLLEKNGSKIGSRN